MISDTISPFFSNLLHLHTRNTEHYRDIKRELQRNNLNLMLQSYEQERRMDKDIAILIIHALINQLGTHWFKAQRKTSVSVWKSRETSMSERKEARIRD